MAACKQDDCPMLVLAKNLLEDWYNNKKGSSVQLDGNTSYSSSLEKWITFPYAGSTWKLHGDTKDFAVKEFIDLYHKLEGKGVLIQEKNTLRLASGKGAEGWYCYKVTK